MSVDQFPWRELFRTQFAKLKETFAQERPGLSYEKSHPQEAAYAEFHHSLPVPVRLMALKIAPSPLVHVEGDVAYVVAFDLMRMGVDEVEFLGEESVDVEGFYELLQRRFNWPAGKDYQPTPEFPLNQFGDWDAEEVWYVIFLPYDIASDTDRLYQELWVAFRSWIWLELMPRLTFRIDFMREFNLRHDPIRPRKALTTAARPRAKRSEFSSGFVTPITTETLQRDVSSMQLIPAVPEGVRSLFSLAKRLYVFIYFDWEFRQVSEHYAGIALEAALKARYWNDVRKPVTMTNKKGDQQVFETVSYDHVYNLCMRDRKWPIRSVMVNNKPFLRSNRQILDYLVENAVLTRWEREMCDLLISMRNLWSHPGSVSIMPPSERWFGLACQLINTLFVDPAFRARLLDEHRRKHGLRVKPRSS